MRGVPSGVAPERWKIALEELELVAASTRPFDARQVLAGRRSPVFFGSALANFGVRSLLDGLVELAPPPGPFVGEGAERPRAVDTPFSGFVFKLQANMNPPHRDRVAFVRICSGAFEPGLRATIARTERSLQLKFPHRTFAQERLPIEHAVAGDIVAVVNARGLRIGDTLYSGPRVSFPALPSFAPERFVTARNPYGARDKQFRRGLAEMAAQGVVQVLLQPEVGMREPILGAIGDLQFEVTKYRMANEVGCEIELMAAPWKRACRVEPEQASALQGQFGIELVEDLDRQRVALVSSDFVLEAAAKRFPEIGLPHVSADSALLQVHRGVQAPAPAGC